MAERAAISFVTPDRFERGSVVVLTDKSLRLGPAAENLMPDMAAVLARAAKAAKFEGGAMKPLELLAPGDSALDRIVFVGLGEIDKLGEHDWLRLGGAIAGGVSGEGEATVLLERPDGEAVTAEQAASLALGIVLRAYRFDKYKTKKKDETPTPRQYRIVVDNAKAAAKAWKATEPVADGVALARDLVNEPANVLGPVEFAERLSALSELGVDVEVLDEEALRGLKMGALLGVAQGSARPPRVVVMRWYGGRAKDKPVAFAGKGVVFDSGGISIKPAQGMEDMKGDMGGAAAVAGLMRVLAARKARANVVGVVGLVENMLDGAAQRPGDIVTSMSGKTIEVLNTDAEGRLLLADLLTYAQQMQVSAIIDLATLTGAIMVALGNQYAGLFSNDDALAQAIQDAGTATGEKAWRMPMGAEYDKLIDSKNADMKNIGGRWGGAIIGAQFLHRFVENGVPWAHLDIAGTAMGSPATETNVSWGSGYGVRLLDQFVRARFETPRKE